jgi:hypothetical protein
VGRPAFETPSQQPAYIERYEHDATRGEFNTQNNPLVLSGLRLEERSIFSRLVVSPLRECFVKISSMDEDRSTYSHDECQCCSYGELPDLSGHAKSECAISHNNRSRSALSTAASGLVYVIA